LADIGADLTRKLRVPGGMALLRNSGAAWLALRAGAIEVRHRLIGATRQRLIAFGLGSFDRESIVSP